MVKLKPPIVIRIEYYYEETFDFSNTKMQAYYSKNPREMREIERSTTAASTLTAAIEKITESHREDFGITDRYLVSSSGFDCESRYSSDGAEGMLYIEWTLTTTDTSIVSKIEKFMEEKIPEVKYHDMIQFDNGDVYSNMSFMFNRIEMIDE